MDYKGIYFARGWKGSLADFRKEFQKTWVFAEMEPKTREREMKTAYKKLIAETNKIKSIVTNGNVTGSIDKGKKPSEN